MESAEVFSPYLHDEDILTSLLDTVKDTTNDIPDLYFNLNDLSPSPAINLLPEIKLDREAGGEEDEGFEGKVVR